LKGKLIYDQKGWDNDVILDSNTGDYYPTNYDVNYLTVPVMANWHFGKSEIGIWILVLMLDSY